MRRDHGRPRHAVNKQDRAERDADDNRFGQIAENRQQERRQQNDSVALRGAQQRRERGFLDHVVSDDHENAGEAGQRDERRQRRGDQNEEQQKHRVQNARDRPVRAGANIGRRAGDGAGDADAAENRRSHIRNPLRHKFAV